MRLDTQCRSSATASGSIAARSAAEARCRPRLNGCSRAGMKRSASRPSALGRDLPDDKMPVVNRIE